MIKMFANLFQRAYDGASRFEVGQMIQYAGERIFWGTGKSTPPLELLHTRSQEIIDLQTCPTYFFIVSPLVVPCDSTWEPHNPTVSIALYIQADCAAPVKVSTVPVGMKITVTNATISGSSELAAGESIPASIDVSGTKSATDISTISLAPATGSSVYASESISYVASGSSGWTVLSGIVIGSISEVVLELGGAFVTILHGAATELYSAASCLTITPDDESNTVYV